MNTQQKTVCWNAIVKNEAKIIERCMQSLVGEIDYWVVVDTGSKDGTQDVIRRFMEKNDIPGELIERPWKDFATNRSEALKLAENKADYVLFCDADMSLKVIDPGWKQHLNAAAYMVNQTNRLDLTYANIRLVNARLEGDERFRYWGASHEYCDSIEPEKLEKPFLSLIEMADHGDGGSKSDKYERDIRLLSRQLQQLKALTPAKPEEWEEAWRSGLLRHLPVLQKRCTFYLAQSWYGNDELEMALATHLKRSKQGGWSEEVWYSLLQIAIIKEKLEYPEEDIVRSYLDAFELRPTRAESLYHLAKYYRRRERYELGYVYALAAVSINRPDDILFVSSDVYSWRSKDELAVCSFWLGKYQMAISISQGLLSNNDLPKADRSRITENMELSKKRLVP